MFKSTGEWTRTPLKKDDSSEFNINLGCNYCDDGGWCSETEVVIHKKGCHAKEIDSSVRQNINKVCLSCVNIFPDKQSLVCHYKSAHLLSSPNAKRIERQIYICDYCREIFFNKKLFELHISYKHLQCKFLYCPICTKQLRRETLWRHCESHDLHSVSICPICLKKCSNLYTLQNHIMSHPKYLHCDVCGYTARQEEQFNSHIRRHVAGDVNEEVYQESYPFRYCIFRTKRNWRHSFARNGVRGMSLTNKFYICILCRQICMSRNSFEKHLYKVHREFQHQFNNTQHMCACGEVFSQNVFLKQHVLKMKSPHRSLSDGVKLKELLSVPNDELDTTEVWINQADSPTSYIIQDLGSPENSRTDNSSSPIDIVRQLQ